MKISILLPYKENFSPIYPGAVSLFVKDTANLSKYKKSIVVYGNTDYKKIFPIKYYNILLSKFKFQSKSKQYVDKFIIVESKFSHSGKRKSLSFDLNNYKKFKDKIIYLVIDEEPKDLLKLKNDNNDSSILRLNSIKRLEQSYEYIKFGLEDAKEDDVILLSDNDEIPDLNKFDFSGIENLYYEIQYPKGRLPSFRKFIYYLYDKNCVKIEDNNKILREKIVILSASVFLELDEIFKVYKQ